MLSGVNNGWMFLLLLYPAHNDILFSGETAAKAIVENQYDLNSHHWLSPLYKVLSLIIINNMKAGRLRQEALTLIREKPQLSQQNCMATSCRS